MNHNLWQTYILSISESWMCWTVFWLKILIKVNFQAQWFSNVFGPTCLLKNCSWHIMHLTYFQNLTTMAWFT